MINAIQGIVNKQVPSEIPTVPVVSSFVSGGAHDKLTLTWSASTDDVAVVGYEVRIKKTSDGAFGSWIDAGDVLFYDFTSLDAGTEYQAQVRAYDAVPNYSAASTTATQSTDAIPLILDILGTAAAAFGLRKMRNAYAGACLRVRRSSDNAEQDIGFDGSGSLDWADAISFKGAGDLFVTKWYDQSIAVKDVLQATTSKQPILDTTAEEVVFDGSDELESALNLGISGDFAATVFCLGRNASNTAYFKIGTAAALQMAALYRTNSSQVRIVHAGSNDYPVTSADAATRCLFTYRKEPGAIDATSEIYQDGGLLTVTGTPSTSTPNMTDGKLILGGIGGSAYLNGGLSEVVICPTALGATPRSDGEANIMAYYGL